jgi:hypothetical protein
MWLLGHQYADEFGDAPEHAISITAITNDATMKTIATRVEAYQKKRALPPPDVVSDVVEAQSVEVSEQEGEAGLQVEEDPRGCPESDDVPPCRERASQTPARISVTIHTHARGPTPHRGSKK